MVANSQPYLKILRVFTSDELITLEYESEPGYPQTVQFRRDKWPSGEIDEHVRLAARALKGSLERPKATDLTDVANEAIKE